MFSVFLADKIRLLSISLILTVFGFGLFSASEVVAQGSAANYLGNGGIHTIHGRIYVENGGRSDVIGLKIRLFNLASNELSVLADGTGTFTFKNLLPGSYTVQIEGGDHFESVQENVLIDDPGSSNLSSTVRLRGGAKTANVQVYLEPKRTKEMLAALEVINAKLASVPKPAVKLYESAQRSINEKNETKAIAELRNAVAIHKEFSMAWNLLGLLLQKAADNAGAVNAFRSAVKYDATSAATNLNLGCALFNENNYEEAEKHLINALVINPFLYRGHYYMGLTQLKLKRIDVAEQAFRKAIEVGNNEAGMAHYMLGGIYWSLKRYKDAADELELYLKLEPGSKDLEKTRASIAALRSKQN